MDSVFSGICSDCKDGSGFEFELSADGDGVKNIVNYYSVCCGAPPVEETLQQHFENGRPYVHIG